MDGTVRQPEAQDAFRALFDRTHREVAAYCRRRTTTPADANDATAETYLVAWRRFADVPAGEEALPWLMGTARRVLSNQRRSHRRWHRLVLRVHGTAGRDEVAPDDMVVEHEEHRDVLEALDRLPERDRELIRLTTLDGVSIVDAARILGCSRNAVDQRLHRARRRLAAEYEQVHSRRAATTKRGR